MGAENGKFYVQSRIEHHIGGLLEGQYPLLFRLAHIVPHTDGLTGREGSLVVVADNTTQQTVVMRGYPVVVIERYTRQSRDKYLVFGCLGDIGRQDGIERMDSFNYQYAVALELQFLAVELPLAFTK